MSDEHSFNVEVAKVVGVNAAILLKSIRWWCQKNKANERHFHDGLYWTYNTLAAFCELYPYLGKSAISRALKKLEDEGYIKTGNYNQTAYDRTRWYAITQEGLDLFESFHFPFREMEEDESGNQSEQNETPIPVVDQLDKPSTNQQKKKERRKPAETFDSIIDGFTDNEELRDALREFLKYRRAKGKGFTNTALKRNLSKLSRLSRDPHEMAEIVYQSIERGWSGLFPLKDDAAQGRETPDGMVRDRHGRLWTKEEYDDIMAYNVPTE